MTVFLTYTDGCDHQHPQIRDTARKLNLLFLAKTLINRLFLSFISLNKQYSIGKRYGIDISSTFIVVYIHSFVQSYSLKDITQNP